MSDKGVITLEGPSRTTLISLLTVSDDAVMFLDQSGNLLVGNASFSYTLERRKSAAKGYIRAGRRIVRRQPGPYGLRHA